MTEIAHGALGRPALLARLRERLRHGELGPIPVLAGLVVIAIVFQSLNPNFLTPRNMSNLILQIGVVGTLGSGVVLALLLGEIDLSLGAVAGVAAAVLGVMLSEYGWPGWLALLAAIVTGALLGLLQGFVIVVFRVPSFIATLAGLLAWQGVQLILLGPTGERLVRDPLIRSIASGYLSPAMGYAIGALVVLAAAAVVLRRRTLRQKAGLDNEPAGRAAFRLAALALVVALFITALNAYFGVPFILLLLGAVVLTLTWFTERTMTGRHIYAIGGHAEAARRAGIPVAAVRIGVFSLIAALAGLGGVISASRQFAVSIGTGGGTLLLDAIAAAVIGGTSLFGGRGRIYHAILGALVIGSVANGLDLLGSPSSTKNIATGAILVIAVAIDAMARANRQNR
ncbi:sugar ABC transporter permease [Mesorhizobium sp. BAC0120]|uniref:sugar ABC transporter permease n=1 Tax=Mesorhizobium sp. BAC0120 TaxID=3090670 RepID=UPI00298BE00C|nr:sugar ABC transporter permease [Mesorhizobium sp. BAC0120]MDW6025427.1 sugar ABC transporter permease [Mesorhizobium sp. BAC0120]